MSWDLIIGYIYMFSYILDPLVFAFKFELLGDPWISMFSEIVTYMIILDILLVPVTGKPKDDNQLPDSKELRKELKKAQRSGVGRIRTNNLKNQKSLNDPTLERDICVLTKSYLKGDAILDILANIP